jgi:hypothetical protein
MAAKQKGVNLALNINVDISKGDKEQVKEEDEVYGSKVALADDAPSFQEQDPPISEILNGDEVENAVRITSEDENVNIDKISNSNADNFTPAVLQVNNDAVKYVSMSTSGERDNSAKAPTTINKTRVLEVNAQLSKHDLPANLLIAVSLEGSNQNNEACRASRDSVKKFEIENGGCVQVYAPGETSRIIRNIIVISIAFMVHFTAFCGTSNLQSSINAVEGLGTASLMAIYISMMISTIFLPVVVIRLVMFVNGLFLYYTNHIITL